MHYKLVSETVLKFETRLRLHVDESKIINNVFDLAREHKKAIIKETELKK